MFLRKTKIICTIGPVSEDPKKIEGLIKAGMNVARLNMSHGNFEEHERRIKNIREISNKMNVSVAILLDTKGPEIRLRKFDRDEVFLKKGDIFHITSKDVLGNENIVSISYPDLIKDISIGNKILLNDGLVSMVVKSKTDDTLECSVIEEGILKSNKSVYVPDVKLSMPYLSDVDKEDILFGIRNDVDYIAASFVSTSEDIKDIKNFVKVNGGIGIDVIAKIENRLSVKNMDEIIAASDGVMVARGDLGVEVPLEEVPFIQKTLIKKCHLFGKRVITATEMLESMIEKPRPTRAEATDVANAVFDGTSAIMLSGETAAGKYPILAVETMSKIAKNAELNINYFKRFKNIELKIQSTPDAVSHATCSAALDLNAKAIVVFTKSGSSARMVSRFRPSVPIIAACGDLKTFRRMSMSWGVTPVLCDIFGSTDAMFQKASDFAKSLGFAKSGDVIVVTAGVPLDVAGNTNLLKVSIVD